MNDLLSTLENKAETSVNTLQKVGLIAAACVVVMTGSGRADEAGPKTVEALYPNLASGVLTYAQPTELPQGVLLKVEGLEITLAALEAMLAQQSAPVQAMYRSELFYVLEQESAGRLLALIARSELDGQDYNLEQMDDNELINILLERLTRDVTATEDDQRTFFDDNPHLFHGAQFEAIQRQIELYLIQQKKQDAVDDYITALGRRMTIQVAADWTEQQALAARNNPLDKARRNGAPTVALFSSPSPCCPDTTAPALAAVRRELDSELNVVLLNPNTEPVLAARYAVRGNPSLLFYDADGKEVYRQQREMTQEQITAKLSELGLI